MKTLSRALRGLALIALTFAAIYSASPAVRAGVNDLASWGTASYGTLLYIDSAGILKPAADLGESLGDSTHRFSSSYINRATGATINASNSTLTSVNVGTVWLTNMTGNHTLTLPTASSAGAGAWIRVIDTGGKISSTGNLTVNVTSSGNINAADTFSVNNATYEHADFFSNGSAWFASVSTKTN